MTCRAIPSTSEPLKKNKSGGFVTLAWPLVALFLALHGESFAAAVADSGYPDRPIRLIVPSAASGSPDTITRTIANQLTKQMGQQVVIDNRPGGSYTIGTGTRTSRRSSSTVFTLTSNPRTTWIRISRPWCRRIISRTFW